MLLKLLRRQPKVLRIEVDYPTAPRLPNGANFIISHNPLRSEVMEVYPKQLQLMPMIPCESCEEFVDKNPEQSFVDALWLDGLMKTLAPGGKRSKDVEKVFLDGFWGQILFLKTVFDTDSGPAYAFFNWSEVAPIGRYLCPTENPVRPDIPVYAAVYKESQLPSNKRR